MKTKVKELLTKKESELVESCSVAHVRFHSPDRLKVYIKLTRKLRDKYRDLNQRQKAASRGVRNFRTGEKAQVFGRILKRYEQRYQEII